MDKYSKSNTFCYACGKLVIKTSRRKISAETADLYQQYFSPNVCWCVLDAVYCLYNMRFEFE